MGAGTRSCTQWLQWKAEKNGEARALALEWVQGFLSAHNAYARQGGGAPVDSIVANPKMVATLMDGFCEKNSNSRIVNGAIDMAKGLGGASLNTSPAASANKPSPQTKPERDI